MNNYYYIVASLPAIAQDWKFGDITAESIVREIKERSTPADLAVIDFIESGFADGGLNEDFYRKAISHKLPFIREYYTFDLNVRNAKVRFLNKALGREADKDVIDIDTGEFEDAAAVDSILDGKDILGREKALDDLYWEKLDSMTVHHYFDMDVILAFIFKLHIIDRWHKLDEQRGREMFKKLVDEIIDNKKQI